MKNWLSFLSSIFSLLMFSIVCAAQPLVLAHHDAFDSYYDVTMRNPVCVVWTLTPDDFKGILKPSSRHFKVDTQLPPPRILDKDFRGSGYVRGHVCPAGDRDTSKRLLKQTYLTSNVCPMTMNTNSGPWKAVEDSCRALALSHGKIKISAGPIFMNCNTHQVCNTHLCNTDSSGKSKLIVPDGFWRIAKCLVHPDEMWIWYVSNSFVLTSPVRLDLAELQKVLPTAVRNTQLLRYLGYY